ncbi:unnamed protein product, partial [Mycena citricolor]
SSITVDGVPKSGIQGLLVIEPRVSSRAVCSPVREEMYTAESALHSTGRCWTGRSLQPTGSRGGRPRCRRGSMTWPES